MTRACMPLDVPDYRADTGHLSTIEHGAYLLLIMHYWMTGGLPGDDAKLARITGMTQQEWTQAKPTLEALFTADWRHKRIERELREAASSVFELRRQLAEANAKIEALEAELAAKRTAGAKRTRRWRHGDVTGDVTTQNTPLSKEDIKERERGANKRGTRLSDDWKPSSKDIEAAKAEGLTDSDVARESAKFRDYWIAKPGAAGVKLDWPATWRNWSRRAAEYLGRSPKPVNGEAKTVFVSVESNQWGYLAGKWREQNHKTMGPPARDYEGQSGWWFPKEWTQA